MIFLNFVEEEEKYSIPILNSLRAEGIPAELFPSPLKIKKQMAYANRRDIPWVVIAGVEEIKEGRLTLKNMKSGEQTLINKDELIDLIRETT